MQNLRKSGETETRQSGEAAKRTLGIYNSTYLKLKQAAFRGLKVLYDIVGSSGRRLFGTLQSRPKNIRLLVMYGLIGVITLASIGFFLRVHTLKAVLKNGTVQEAKDAAEELGAYGITEIEEKRIADCKYLMQNKEYDYAALAAESLKKTKSTAPYGYIFSGQIALQKEEYEKASIAFQQAKKQRGGKKIIKKNLSGILGSIEPELKKDKAPQSLINLVAVTLSAAKEPEVDKWTEHTHYWIRWNAVNIKKRAGAAVDTVGAYILDLKHGGSMRTRVRAARKLGEAGDKRAIKPLREAKERGIRDPFVSGTAATVLEKYFE